MHNGKEAAFVTDIAYFGFEKRALSVDKHDFVSYLQSEDTNGMSCLFEGQLIACANVRSVEVVHVRWRLWFGWMMLVLEGDGEGDGYK